MWWCQVPQKKRKELQKQNQRDRREETSVGHKNETDGMNRNCHDQNFFRLVIAKLAVFKLKFFAYPSNYRDHS